VAPAAYPLLPALADVRAGDSLAGEIVIANGPNLPAPLEA
jgi:hypothetical protein